MAFNYGHDMAALNGDVVKEGHAQFCAKNGHATHTVNGTIQVFCPRCGDPVGAVSLPAVDIDIARTADRVLANHGSVKAAIKACTDTITSTEKFNHPGMVTYRYALVTIARMAAVRTYLQSL